MLDRREEKRRREFDGVSIEQELRLFFLADTLSVAGVFAASLKGQWRGKKEIKVIKIIQRIFKLEAEGKYRRSVFPIVSNQSTGGCNLQIRKMNKDYKINSVTERRTVHLKGGINQPPESFMADRISVLV